MQTTSPATFKLPTLLSYVPRAPGERFARVVPGRGDAGWAIYEFATKAERVRFMAANPASAMPCWRRIEVAA